MTDELRSTADDFVRGSEVNALMFVIRTLIRQTVNTAIPVVVTSVERTADGAGAGYLSAKPLVVVEDASGNGIPTVEIPRLPYFRIQHGSAAIICDPKVGDIGLAVFAQADSSNVNGEGEPKPPASHRYFDMSDGFYFGGFWGQAPTTFVRIEDSGDITITAPSSVTINTESATLNTETATVNASSSYEVNSPLIRLNGKITGGGSGGATATFTGDVVVTGDVTATGTSLHTHKHRGDSGGETSAPL